MKRPIRLPSIYLHCSWPLKSLIPGNNRPATAENLLRQGCRLIGEWERYGEAPLLINAAPEWNACILGQGQLVIYTSGSTDSLKPSLKRRPSWKRKSMYWNSVGAIR
ncbi:hypothetical protein [methane-oxidizing endosymbiont of Gigantopelta aegis]|uniref:hypothetical protein n=1 Tax=methane-oxidizing endosymbiont of Gigantopelta aegis TaxID=2794938 RepID=UPI0018DC8D61|nr:hypothetical protein [methane-oxidizing endosymbiont of Gigantopelta aegis]